MRVVHISDLHLSKENLPSFKKFYLDALLKDLREFHRREKIEIVFLTGDLVDKGGRSLGPDCYQVVEKEFIRPVLDTLNLSNDKLIMLPGNHDIDSATIDEVSEHGLLAMNNVNAVNKFVSAHRNSWHDGTSRLKAYQAFENGFYSGINDCYLSHFESCFVTTTSDQLKIGIAALNSAWRCSPTPPDDKILLGTEQILEAKEFFKKNQTNFNFLLVHHPIDMFEHFEKQEIKGFISNFGFHAVLAGHTHHANQASHIGVDGNLFYSTAKSAFSNPRETYDLYKPGYVIMDFNISQKGTVEVQSHFRKYIHQRVTFDKDVETSQDGFYKLVLPITIDLPPSYKSSEVSAEAVKEPIAKAWNEVTDVLIKSAFPHIGEKMASMIKKSMLPGKLDHYNSSMDIYYELKRVDDKHFSIDESQEFTVISDGSPFVLKTSYFIEKENNKLDKSDIDITEFFVDDQPVSEAVEVKTRIMNDGLLKKSIWLDLKLEGKKEYKVKITVKSVHSLVLNGIWKFDITRITENLTLQVTNTDGFELDIIKYGNSNSKETSAFLNVRKISYENLVMPGEGFILVVKNKGL